MRRTRYKKKVFFVPACPIRGKRGRGAKQHIFLGSPFPQPSAECAAAKRESAPCLGHPNHSSAQGPNCGKRPPTTTGAAHPAGGFRLRKHRLQQRLPSKASFFCISFASCTARPSLPKSRRFQRLWLGRSLFDASKRKWRCKNLTFPLLRHTIGVSTFIQRSMSHAVFRSSPRPLPQSACP